MATLAEVNERHAEIVSAFKQGRPIPEPLKLDDAEARKLKDDADKAWKKLTNEYEGY